MAGLDGTQLAYNPRMKKLFPLAALIIASLLVSPASTQAPYRLVEGWGALPAGTTYGQVPGMAIDADGRVFVFHRNQPPIVEIDGASGKVLKMWGENQFAWPHGIRVDRD